MAIPVNRKLERRSSVADGKACFGRDVVVVARLSVANRRSAEVAKRQVLDVSEVSLRRKVWHAYVD